MKIFKVGENGLTEFEQAVLNYLATITVVLVAFLTLAFVAFVVHGTRPQV